MWKPRVDGSGGDHMRECAQREENQSYIHNFKFKKTNCVLLDSMHSASFLLLKYDQAQNLSSVNRS